MARIVARPLTAFSTATRPIRWCLRALTNASLQRFQGSQAEDGDAGGIDEQEFRTLVDAGAREGVVEKQERELIHNVLDFGDLRVKDVYRPLEQVFCLSERTSIEEALQQAAARRHSRIPVWRRDPHHLVGVVYAKDLLSLRWGVHPPRSLRTLVRRPVITLANKPADDLLDELRRTRTHMAIVVDEFGRASGICTMEDLLEELFGPITDVPGSTSAPPPNRAET